MATTTLRVTNIMTQDGAPASGVHPTDSSPDTSLATVGYVNTKISGVGELDTNISALQGKITNLQNQLNNIQSTALTRAQYGALKDQLTSDINVLLKRIKDIHEEESLMRNDLRNNMTDLKRYEAEVKELRLQRQDFRDEYELLLSMDDRILDCLDK